MLDRVIRLDFWLFNKINGQWTNDCLDVVLPLLRESIFWIPLYFFLLIFIWANFGKKGLYWALFLICTAAMCDVVSSHIIKQAIFRYRPCRNPEIGAKVRLLVSYCGSNSSFTSSHATSHFGIAMFIYKSLGKYTSGWTGLFFIWAAVICYAQVYVGVHFPFDILCGALVGCMIGYSFSWVFNKYVNLGTDS
jgi:membrane-associated phospholipid phosphatase